MPTFRGLKGPLPQSHSESKSVLSSLPVPFDRHQIDHFGEKKKISQMEAETAIKAVWGSYSFFSLVQNKKWSRAGL